MFVLQLNDMRSSNVEIVSSVARAETAEELTAMMERESVEPYRSEDDRWYKCYREGGPLEWFNPPFSMDVHIVDVGDEEEWAESARVDFQNRVMIIPEAKFLSDI